MTEVQSFVFIIGAAVVDALEQWTLALIATAIAADLLLGFRYRTCWILAVVQIVGLILGCWLLLTLIAHLAWMMWVLHRRWLQNR